MPEHHPDREVSLINDDEIGLLDLLVVVFENLKLLIATPIAAGLIALGLSYAVTPVYTAKTTILPSAGGGGGAAAAILGQLGPLSGMLGNMPSLGANQPLTVKTMAYLKSDLLRDEMIKKFDLQKRFGHQYISQTRETLKSSIEIKEDKKTSLVTIEYADADPVFAADLVNEYVATARRLLGQAALTEAREQRDFLEGQITEANKKAYQSPIVREAIIQTLVRQFEAKRLEERQPDPTILQIDVAKPPELKSGPKRALIASITALATGFALLSFVLIRHVLRNASHDPQSAGKIRKIRSAFGK